MGFEDWRELDVERDNLPVVDEVADLPA